MVWVDAPGFWVVLLVALSWVFRIVGIGREWNSVFGTLETGPCLPSFVFPHGLPSCHSVL